MAATNAFNITTLKGALKKGGARPSLFEFEVSGGPADLTDIKYFCHVSSLPALSLTPIEKQYFGRTVKIPGDIVFADLTTTIFQTEKGNERFEIESWMDQINGHVHNTGSLDSSSSANFTSKYSATGTLYQYPKSGKTTTAGILSIVKFIDMWPTVVAEIPLSYDTASDIEQFDVTWAYQYYTVKIGSASYI